MGIRDELQRELAAAMKERDRARLDVIRQIETEVSRARAEPGFSGDVDDSLYEKVLAAYVKKMDKARIEYEGLGDRGREQAEKLAFEVDYLGRWLPQALGEDETRSIVAAAIAEVGADDSSMAGRVVGHVMKAGHEGIDGALVNRLARELLEAE